MKNIFNKIFVLFIVLSVIFSGSSSLTNAAESIEWNVMDKKFTNYDGWRISQGTAAVYESEVVQNDDYVTIKNKEVLTEEDNDNHRYYFLISPETLVFPHEGEIVVEFEVRVPDGYEYRQQNEVSIRAAGRNGSSDGRIAKLLFYSDSKEDNAHLLIKSTQGDQRIDIDTASWHTYRVVMSELDSSNNRTYAVYVDGYKVADNLNAPKMDGKDLIRVGHDNGGTSNLDLRSMKVKANINMITTVSTSHPVISYVDGVMGLTLNGVGIETGIDYQISLIDKDNRVVEPFETIRGTLYGETTLDIPMSSELEKGAYRFRIISGEDDQILYSSKFSVVEEVVVPTFPIFEYYSEPVSKEDHIYESVLNPHANPTEFNFPSVIDTHLTHSPLDNGLVDEYGVPFRYYLFYAPHDDPGGISMMMAQDLNGPWTEYANNPFIENVWFREDGSEIYRVPHVSSPDVIWNETEQLFFLYFHGNNTQTRFATSPDLIHWTYGDIAVVAKDFMETGNEASYARVYEHTVPGLDNKYIMLLMGKDHSGIRKIYWAHSQDGRNWAAVKEPLADPLNAPDGIDYSSGGYNGPGSNSNFSGSNLSGPFFWHWQDRYFLIAHGSNGDIMIFEVGEDLSQEIHWGILYDSVYGEPDLGRSGAGYFIQDDSDTWHMFYEGGSRLKNNILHGKEKGPYTVDTEIKGEGTLSLSSKTLYEGARLDITFNYEEDTIIKVATLNGQDILNDIVDDHYILNAADASVSIYVEYENEMNAPKFMNAPNSVKVGESFTLEVLNDDQKGEQGWDWDQTYLSATFNSPATFTALNHGETRITYTNTHGETITHKLLIEAVEDVDDSLDNNEVPPTDSDSLPETGSASWVPLGVTLLVMGFMIIRTKRKED